MFSIRDGFTGTGSASRREWLRVGGLSALGLSLPALGPFSPQLAASPPAGSSFGRAKNVLFLWLQGGPPQHETFDPKPEAPAEIRGEFQAIQTNIPGICFSELLPRLAARADRLAIVRSLCTHSDLHDASAYWILTGYRYTGQQSRQISPTDWPYLGSVLKQVRPSASAPAFSSVWLPDVMRLNDNVMPAGQTAGFLGSQWEPFRIIGDPSAADFTAPGLRLPGDIPPLRLTARRQLLEQVNGHLVRLERQSAVQGYSHHVQEAFGLLASGQGRSAFDLRQEPDRLRDRYGRNAWGQSLLLARRLIESGARLVHVNWPRDPGDEAVANPMWDTHSQNSDRLQDVLCPLFDIGFSALLDDLQDRGLLDETLVVAIGEFGRTPKINSQGGRDHWGHVFSFALAGAGIQGGQVYGASDRQGGYPREGRLEPQDLTATIVHLLGVDPRGTFQDAAGRPYHITKGEPIARLLGTGPATAERVASTGNLALVPAYSRDPLLNLGFEDDVPLPQVGTGNRWKGWQGAVLPPNSTSSPWQVAILAAPEIIPGSGQRAAVLGWSGKDRQSAIKLGADAGAMLTQELRNPRGGTYSVTLRASLQGDAESCRQFLQAFRCRLVLFGYRDLAKDPRQARREYVSQEFQPSWIANGAEFESVSLSYFLRSQDAGAREIEMGVGIAVLVERTTAGTVAVNVGGTARVVVDDVQVTFTPRPRNDNVTV